MIDLNSQLTVLHTADELAFTDYSNKSGSFAKDTFTLAVESTDYFYVGFRKPISGLYFNHNTTYTTDGVLSGEYYNGSAWVSLDSSYVDDTVSLKRSGFIRWNVAQTNQATSTVNGKSLYWYRFNSSVDRAAMIIAGINLVFADDYDLSLEQPLINDTEFKGSQTSHILIHAAVRNEILQKFKNKDYLKVNSSGVLADINQWDLHNILEVKQAAVFLALSKIYENMSDASNDVWSEKAAKYSERYDKMINLARLSLDTNDDGVEQAIENKPNFTTRYMTR